MTDHVGTPGQILGFMSAAIPKAPFQLRGVAGHEALGELYRYQLYVGLEGGPLRDGEIDAMMNAQCAVALGSRPEDIVHGMLECIELIDERDAREARYLLSMVPTAAMMRLSRRCRIYQNLTTVELVEQVLSAYGLTQGKDFEIRVHAELRKREYVVQYQESDWDFLQRWLEHEGMFFWFVHAKGGEVLVIADENEDCTTIAEPAMLGYRHRNNLVTRGEATVWAFQLVQRHVPARVSLLDYNYRTPHIAMHATAAVDEEHGFGTALYYGEHFKDTTEGAHMAKMRAERFGCERRVFRGHTDCARMHVGHTVLLDGHPMDERNGAYLITSIALRAGRELRGRDPVLIDTDDNLALPLRSSFTAIPVDIPFRPQRRVPWPRIHSIMHAHIDADTSGATAQIDDAGRYKVRLPFDTSSQSGSASSRWIRMAQPSAGAGYGTHFPLHKGTEVLLAHIDGDPDRPIIIGSVPNAHTISPATSANATQSVIQTAAGIRIEMEDQQS